MSVLPATTFKAMGTEIEVLAYPELPLHIVDQVQARFFSVEAALSRFRADSELSRLNRSARQPFRASPLLLDVLGGALDAARRTRGLFDPTVIYGVEAAGYTRSFDAMKGAGEAVSAPGMGRYSDVEVNNGLIVLRNGVRIDLGGYAKGWTVDSCRELMLRCETWVINAGGDLLAHGPGPTGGGWLVGVEDPFDPSRDIGVLSAKDAAIATTSRMRRRWKTALGEAHHIIDPGTGRPAYTGLASVTVVSSSVAKAEIWAKALFLLGPRQGPRAVEEGVVDGAVFVTDNGADLWAGRARALRVS